MEDIRYGQKLLFWFIQLLLSISFVLLVWILWVRAFIFCLGWLFFGFQKVSLGTCCFFNILVWLLFFCHNFPLYTCWEMANLGLSNQKGKNISSQDDDLSVDRICDLPDSFSVSFFYFFQQSNLFKQVFYQQGGNVFGLRSLLLVLMVVIVYIVINPFVKPSSRVRFLNNFLTGFLFFIILLVQTSCISIWVVITVNSIFIHGSVQKLLKIFAIFYLMVKWWSICLITFSLAKH